MRQIRPIDRLESAESALAGIRDLLCGSTDLHCVNPDNLYTLLDLIVVELRTVAKEFPR